MLDEFNRAGLGRLLAANSPEEASLPSAAGTPPRDASQSEGQDHLTTAWDVAVGETWSAIQAGDQRAFGAALHNALKVLMHRIDR